MFHQYDRLIRVLASYRSIRASGGWQLVDPVVLMARVGDADSSIAQLRKRLLQSDDLQDTSTSDLYDDALALAIKRFRLRHGLNGEAKLDSATLRLLNLPVDSGIRTILLNLERCRWVPEDPIGRHLVVNIPAFRLYAFSDSGFAWSTRVIVGKVGTATTIFTGSIRTLVLNPTWTVPRKIVYEEIIPAQRANADYLTRNKMDLFRPADLSHPVNPKKIDWKRPDLEASLISSDSAREVGMRSVVTSSSFQTRTIFTCTIRHPVSCSSGPSVPSVMAAYE